ncbi:hypothetical protein OROHE_001265 [Orobanche hederae]
MAWGKVPVKKKQVVVVGGKESKAEQSHHELEVGNRGKDDWDLKKIISAQEEENCRLTAELARKDELLKAYEAVLAERGDKLLFCKG